MAAAGILYFEVVNLTIPACRQCNLRYVPNLVQISVIVTEIDALMLKTFI